MEQLDDRFAELVIKQGLVPREQVEKLSEAVRKASALGAATNLPDTLVGKGFLTRAQADALLEKIRSAEPKITSIAGCELIEKLGEGAIGAVYKARQVSMSRIVAVKLLKPALSRDEAFVERFSRQAHTAAKLDHHNIIRAIDAGFDQGYHYFVMEFVDGPTLARMLARGPLSEAQALKITYQIAQALAHAQGNDILHGGIRPHNIMLTSDGTAKLADLGMSRTFSAGGPGSAHYVSPEQAGGGADIDIRTDIYSLGATLYHMVTGVPPFAGGSDAAVLSKRLTQAPPDPREVRPDISTGVGSLVLRMMARDPAQRYATPQELLNSLEIVMQLRPAGPDTGPDTAPDEGPTEPTTQKRRLSAKTALIIGTCIAALIVVAALVLAPRPPAAPPATKDEAQEAYAAAVAYQVEHPGELTAAISQFRAVKEKYDGTAWAQHAAARIRELEEEKTSIAIDAGLAELKSGCTALLGKEKFGEALKRLDLFIKECPSTRAVRTAKELRRAVRAEVGECYTELARRADVALAAKDYGRARAALESVQGFGITELTEKAEKKLAEIDTREKDARQRAGWEDIKARAAKLAEAGEYERARMLLQTAKDLQLRRIDQLIARELETIDRAEDAVRGAIERKYAAAFEAEVMPLLTKRSYPEAAEALEKLAARDDFELLADELRRARADIGRLVAFWRQLEELTAGLKPGQIISIGDKKAQFMAYENGLIRYKAGQAQVGVRLRRMKAQHIIALLGRPSLEEDETRIGAALFLLHDEDSDPIGAYDLLTEAKPGPDVERYKMAAAKKVGARRFGADEQAAADAFSKLTDVVAKVPSQLTAMLVDFRNRFGHTRFFNEHLVDIALLKAGPADANVRTWNGRRYILLKRAALWSDAKLQCERLGGHLVTITSAKEQRFIGEKFDANVWLGATDEHEEGQWEWVTGEEWSYASWMRGQPDDAWGKEHWAEMVGWGEKPEWNDAPAIARRQYICEWEKDSLHLKAEEWRELAGALGLNLPRTGEFEYRKRLGRLLSYKGRAVPLQYAVVGIVNQLDIPYLWVTSADLVGPDLAARPIDPVVRDSSAGRALTTILEPLNLIYDIDDSGLFITPPESATAEGDDFHGAEQISLTALTPLRSKVGWGALAVNKAEDGAREIKVAGAACREFIYAHANSSIIYEIPRGSAYFVAAGACSYHANKSIRFLVKVDGKLKLKSKRLDRLRGGSVSIRVKLPQGARKIELIVDNCGNSNYDWSVWAFPRFVK